MRRTGTRGSAFSGAGTAPSELAREGESFDASSPERDRVMSVSSGRTLPRVGVGDACGANSVWRCTVLGCSGTNARGTLGAGVAGTVSPWRRAPRKPGSDQRRPGGDGAAGGIISDERGCTCSSVRQWRRRERMEPCWVLDLLVSLWSSASASVDALVYARLPGRDLNVWGRMMGGPASRLYAPARVATCSRTVHMSRVNHTTW